MSNTNQLHSPPAVHLPESNHFDHMLLDIQSSIMAQIPWLKTVQKRSVRRSVLRNKMDLWLFKLTLKANLHELFVNNGLRKSWFEEFNYYWTQICGAKTINIMDFHTLRVLYRTKHIDVRAQTLQWDSPEQHLLNWQTPKENLSFTFHTVYRTALDPIRTPLFQRVLRPDMKILEYGCAIAPMYRMWRQFFNHIPAQWILADIPGFPFHYTRSIFGRDEAIKSFVCINKDRLDDPLQDIPDRFDLIIVTEVFEHLHKPRQMAEYLVNHLANDGLILFDYERSEAKGLDSIAGLTERQKTLEYLSNVLEIINGNFHMQDKTVDQCVGRKKH